MSKLPTATYPNYTNLKLRDGLFDQLMATVDHHLQNEWKAQRLRGDAWTKVYLGSMEAVMANTTQYLLGILLIDQKKAQILLENDLLELKKEELRFKIDQLYPLEVIKTNAEIDLINAQIGKISKEIEYITQKIVTEVANVDSTGVDPASIIGRQTDLLYAQKLGFAGDIRNKAAKMYADYDGLYMSVLETSPATLGFDADAHIQLALDTATAIFPVADIPPDPELEPLP